ncbi:molybdopterin-binding protein [Sporomusa aerivorans]|uniref:molybdopterin-binding protein n=1 Tax=Sporomusa aerivorans TaxID=204936 RepID=UPI00352B0B3D
MDLNLLEKTELKIYGLNLQSVNLTRVAEVVAKVLGLPVREVLVVDVRYDHICLDILAKSIDMRQIIGKEQALLYELAAIDGLELTSDAYVDSAGIMGLIGCEEADAGIIAQRTEAVADEITRAVLGRALVYATGFEVKNGMIEDTNSPYLIELLQSKGYKAEFGGILEDDVSVIAHKLRDAAERGFGLVITTGGVGAEDKDFSVEALARMDSEAATPWIVKFQVGTGRHVKEGVRIAVGQSGLTTFVSLPGPHDEVVAAGAALQNHCYAHQPIEKNNLANDIAHILRDKLRHKHWHGQHHH